MEQLVQVTTLPLEQPKWQLAFALALVTQFRSIRVPYLLVIQVLGGVASGTSEPVKF